MADIRNRELKFADIRFDWDFHGYTKVFEGNTTFSDIDAVINNNGHFLFIEHKRMKPTDKPPTLPPGQRGVYTELASLPKFTAWLVAGDMQLSIPYWVENLETGAIVDLRQYEPRNARAALTDLLASWYASTK